MGLGEERWGWGKKGGAWGRKVGLGEERWGWGKKGGAGVGVSGHAHRFVLILPAKLVFPFFRVNASFGDDSSLRRFTSGRGKCLVQPPA